MLYDSAAQEAPSDNLFDLLHAKLPHHYLCIHARSIFYVSVQVFPHAPARPLPLSERAIQLLYDPWPFNFSTFVAEVSEPPLSSGAV